MLPPRDLLWCLSKTWSTEQSFAAGIVMNLNGGKFLSQTSNSLAFCETAFFVGRKLLLSCKLHQNTVFCLLNFIHFCPLSSYRVWQGKISVNSRESQSLWTIELHDCVGTGLAGSIDQKGCSSAQWMQHSPNCPQKTLAATSPLGDSQHWESNILFQGSEDPS